MKLFTIVNGDIVINKIELLAIPTFKYLLSRDKGIGKDHFKKQAFNELLYIYYIADKKSLPNTKGYNDKDTADYAIHICNFGVGWKPDDVIIKAIDIYIKEQSTISTDTINELVKTFRFTGSVIKKVRASIEDLLNTEKLTKEQASEVLGLIEIIIKFGKDIPQLTRDLNTAISELYKDDDADIELLRGSKEPIPMSANPDTDF